MKSRRGRSFAEIVDDVKQTPPPKAHTPHSAAESITDPAGRVFREVEEQLTPERAQELVAKGAALAWDDCGSRGYAAPVVWIAPDDAARLAAAGPPVLPLTTRQRGELGAWQSSDGAWLVLASMSVRWGRLLA